MPCVDCSNGLGSMGQGTGAELLAINEAFVHAKDLWEDIQRIFGIGAGRREADVITPLQDKITELTLTPAAEMTTNPENYTCAQFQQMLGAINQAESQFKSFLTTTTWQDGRAAQQALWWLTGSQGTTGQDPWFKIIKDDFLEAMEAKNCGGTIGGIFTTPTGDINWPIVAVAGGALFMLTRRKSK